LDLRNGIKPASFQLQFHFWKQEEVTERKIRGDDSHFVFRQKILGEEESVRRGVVMVKQQGLISPKFGATSSHVFTQSSQNLKFTVWPVGTGASRYHDCCIDGGTSPEYFGYHLV
jgi:hypothetical protein